MNKHVGRKIKVLASIIMWVQIIAFVIGGIALIISGEKLIRFNSDLSVLFGVGIGLGVGILVLFAWISSWMLYGYGQLIDSTQNIEEMLRNSNPQQPAQLTYNNPVQSRSSYQTEGFYFCTHCGAKVPSNQPVCPSCGHSR